MEMEHINENTIRVLIGNEDLADRGITFLDLLGNHKDVENFFYSILEEVDVEDEFQGSEAVTFQVLPKNDGLELFISKNVAMDDLSSLEGLSEVNADVSELIHKQIEADKAAADELDEMEATDETNRNVIFELDNFEAMIQLSKEVFMQSVLTNLYTYNDRHYLQVLFLTDELEKTNVDNEIAQILEFAHKTTVTQDTLVEYGTCIMERSALELTRYYFND